MIYFPFRQVVGHPCFVVLLRRENEFGEFEFPMVGEVEQALLNAERERTVVVKGLLNLEFSF